MSTVQKAIILAAGRSKRLGELTRSLPKCLLPVGESTIIDLQISPLRKNGITDIVLVTGFCEDKIKAHCGGSVDYVSNEVFERTNSIYSLWLGLKHIGAGGVVILNADVLFHPDILFRLLQSPYPDALAVSLGEKLGAEEMKVQVNGERIVDISKTMDMRVAAGENVGVVKFSADGRAVLAGMVDRLVSDGVVNAWAPLAFQKICSYHSLHYVSTGGLPWVEIDFPEDLEYARSHIYPRIAAETAENVFLQQEREVLSGDRVFYKQKTGRS